MFLSHYRANKKRAPSNRILPPSPPPTPLLYDQSLNAQSLNARQIFSLLIQMTVGSDPLRGGGGGTPFVQVVGEIRGLILELEKYFPCEPLRVPTQKSVT